MPVNCMMFLICVSPGFFLKNKQIQQDFFAQSKYFHYMYWLQLNAILFDDKDELEIPNSQPIALSNLRQIIS